MTYSRKLIDTAKPAAKVMFAAALLLGVTSAPPAFAADDLQSVLHKLDAAAQKFHTTSANVEFDSITTEPIEDKDVQTGTEYFERTGNTYRMGVHIKDDNGHPAPKIVVSSSGTIRLYEQLSNQVTTLTKFSQYQSWFMLGFGASGKELQEKWDIKYAGSEKIDGVTTQKLEMIAKDPTVRKTVAKVTLWMDTDRGVSLKQVFDQGGGQSRECDYTNIKVNQALPGDAFTLPTNKQTRYNTQ